ncbi:MAG: amidophosphoribosyltransferase, partial [Treponema sp.]|nr:amidophosphoribosyltransferase [Treponema sp.]
MTDDKFHDECGVVGIFGADNAARLSYFALTALQHRGQESAGIVVSDTGIASSEGAKISLCKDMGLVGDVFSTEHLQKLSGNISVGHV